MFNVQRSTAQMPLPTVDDSSAVSESQEAIVTYCDGGLCILCGMDPVDVVHIVSRKSGDHRRVSEWLILSGKTTLST
jgi:hypothetical protein